MVAFPPCKINLGLNVVRKRNDGYHDIETCFYPVAWTDILEVIPSDKLEFTSSGNTIPGSAEENLCIKAWKLLGAPPVKIHLHKVIPTGAGLGGGSSDAAWTLRMLNEIFDLKADLGSYAPQLGSDCTFFLHDKPMIGTGKGEILSPVDVPLKGKYLLIVKPDVHVATAKAYEGIVPAIPTRSISDVIPNFNEWKVFLKNDFEATILEIFPVIKSLKEKLYDSGAAYAGMTGSGSAVYGLFDNKPDLDLGDNVHKVVRL